MQSLSVSMIVSCPLTGIARTDQLGDRRISYNLLQGLTTIGTIRTRKASLFEGMSKDEGTMSAAAALFIRESCLLAGHVSTKGAAFDADIYITSPPYR